MMISLRRKLVYLAVPKTGTTSTEAALDEHCEVRMTGARVKHSPYRKYARHIAPFLAKSGYEDMETVCVMREPVDRMRSWYKMWHAPRFRRTPLYSKRMSFDEFVTVFLDNGNDKLVRSVGRQTQFVQDGSGKRGVDHIFRYEDIPGFEKFLARRLRAKISLPRLNVSADAKAPMSPSVKARVETELAAEFELYESLPR